MDWTKYKSLSLFSLKAIQPLNNSTQNFYIRNKVSLFYSEDFMKLCTRKLLLVVSFLSFSLLSAPLNLRQVQDLFLKVNDTSLSNTERLAAYNEIMTNGAHLIERIRSNKPTEVANAQAWYATTIPAFTATATAAGFNLPSGASAADPGLLAFEKVYNSLSQSDRTKLLGLGVIKGKTEAEITHAIMSKLAAAASTSSAAPSSTAATGGSSSTNSSAAAAASSSASSSTVVDYTTAVDTITRLLSQYYTGNFNTDIYQYKGTPGSTDPDDFRTVENQVKFIVKMSSKPISNLYYADPVNQSATSKGGASINAKPIEASFIISAANKFIPLVFNKISYSQLEIEDFLQDIKLFIFTLKNTLITLLSGQPLNKINIQNVASQSLISVKIETTEYPIPLNRFIVLFKTKKAPTLKTVLDSVKPKLSNLFSLITDRNNEIILSSIPKLDSSTIFHDAKMLDTRNLTDEFNTLIPLIYNPNIGIGSIKKNILFLQKRQVTFSNKTAIESILTTWDTTYTLLLSDLEKKEKSIISSLPAGSSKEDRNNAVVSALEPIAKDYVLHKLAPLESNYETELKLAKTEVKTTLEKDFQDLETNFRSNLGEILCYLNMFAESDPLKRSALQTDLGGNIQKEIRRLKNLDPNKVIEIIKIVCNKIKLYFDAMKDTASPLNHSHYENLISKEDIQKRDLSTYVDNNYISKMNSPKRIKILSTLPLDPNKNTSINMYACEALMLDISTDSYIQGSTSIGPVMTQDQITIFSSGDQKEFMKDSLGNILIGFIAPQVANPETDICIQELINNKNQAIIHINREALFTVDLDTINPIMLKAFLFRSGLESEIASFNPQDRHSIENAKAKIREKLSILSSSLSDPDPKKRMLYIVTKLPENEIVPDPITGKKPTPKTFTDKNNALNCILIKSTGGKI